MSDPDGGSADLGEGSGDRRACLRLPALDLEALRIVPVVDHRRGSVPHTTAVSAGSSGLAEGIARVRAKGAGCSGRAHSIGARISARLARGVVASQKELRDRVAVRLLLDYGLRKGALNAVQFKHFDHNRKRLTVFTKGEKVRELPSCTRRSGLTSNG